MVNAKSLISVLIPTYNVENFIEEAINSICIQTYSNLEIIVVDDCSTDLTYGKLLKLAEKDDRIKVYRNDYNRKIAFTLNRAFSLSSGEFIVRMDGDDISLPDKIQLQFDYLLNNPNINLVGSNIYSIDENGNILNKIKTPITWRQVEYLMLKYSPVLHIWMCHRSIYERLNGYRELSGSEDYDFLLRMHTMGFKFLNIPEYTYKVRLRDGNTQSTNGLKQILIAEYVKELFFERRKNKSDTFTNENFLKKTTPNYFFNHFHNISVKITYLAMKKKNIKLFSLILFGLAAVLSPFQLKLFINKFKIKKYLNVN
jgi:glycosyltransferase involved in cell wall biosynthesis